jgi:phosphate transport system permease protein
MRRPLTTLVDLLAAIPSLIFGMWGLYYFEKHAFLSDKWLGHHNSFFPLFRLTGGPIGFSIFDAGLVVGIMVIPIVTSISREIMSLAPREDCEAALALGGTRWGMVTDVILPFARSGIIGSALLGLGRALGETIAVSIILSQNDRLTSHILEGGGGAIAPLIVHEFLGSSSLEQSALMFAGLTLFALTLAVNIGARSVVLRSATT